METTGAADGVNRRRALQPGTGRSRGLDDRDEAIAPASALDHVVSAVRNNADLYAMMFDLHGLRYHRTEAAFWAIDPPPPYFSRMTILEPTPGPELLELIAVEAARPDFGIKDGFHNLDLDAFGLTVFFAATWIRSEEPRADTTRWRRVTTPADLRRWETAWKAGGSPSDRRQFPDVILARPDVALWGRVRPGGFDAGAIANLSPDCVGMSNVFGGDALPAVAALCAGFGSGLPVVGYEHGEALTEAIEAGFEPIGRLRVCGKPSP